MPGVPAPTPADQRRGDALRRRPHIRRRERHPVAALERAGARRRHRAHIDGADRGRGRGGHRRRRAGADAGPHRRALARIHGRDAAAGADDRRRLLPDAVGGAPGRGDADARLHHRARPRRAGVRAEARDRRGRHAWPAHLSLGRDDLPDLRTRRLPLSLRVAPSAGRAAQPLGARRHRRHRRQSRRGPAAGARAAAERCEPGQADGRRRGQLAVQPHRIHPVHRAGAARRGRGRRELGHLRRGACLHAGGDPPGRRCRGQVHRARPAHRRAHRQAPRRPGDSGGACSR